MYIAAGSYQYECTQWPCSSLADANRGSRPAMTQGGLAKHVEDVDEHISMKVDCADGVDAGGCRPVVIETTVHVHLKTRRLGVQGALCNSDNNTNNRCVHVSVCMPVSVFQ